VIGGYEIWDGFNGCEPHIRRLVGEQLYS
jgi:hypothetical protein